MTNTYKITIRYTTPDSPKVRWTRKTMQARNGLAARTTAHGLFAMEHMHAKVVSTQITTVFPNA